MMQDSNDTLKEQVATETQLQVVAAQPKEPEKQLFDLGNLKPPTKLYVSPLPKETQSVVVRYDEGIKLSAVIPPQKLKIRILDSDDDYYEDARVVRCKITTPTLLISVNFMDYPAFGRVPTDGNVYLYVLDSKEKGRIKTTPYLMANVHPNAAICWGTLQAPVDLKAAFNTYVSSNFTPDLLGVEGDLTGYESSDNIVEHIKRYRTKYLKHQKFEDSTSIVCGTKFWAAPKGAEAILITNNTGLLSQIPSKYWLRNSNYDPLVILLATKDNNKWIFESGSYKFSIDADFVTAQAKFSKEVSDTKKKYLSLS